MLTFAILLSEGNKMNTYIWGLNNESGNRTVNASSREEAIHKILTQVGSQSFWIS